jgi:UDP-2-acetamido-2,6-beta-L-arabino-hexul-4-ose reductase
MHVLVEELPVHGDSRGAVFEPLVAEALRDQRNVHVVLSEPGAVRANHYHVRGTEVMTVCGRALVRYTEAGEQRDVVVAQGQALRFTFPPGVSHAVQNIGDTTNVLIAFNTEEHDREAPDVISDVLIAASAKA